MGNTVQADIELIERLAAACKGTFNRATWTIEIPDDIIMDGDFWVNLDESIFEFEPTRMKVYGPSAVKRLQRNGTLSFTGRHCSVTPVMTQTDKMLQFMFIFSHTKNGKKMTADMKAGAA